MRSLVRYLPLALFAACARDNGPGVSPVHSVQVAADAQSILVGATTHVHATLLDTLGAPVTDRTPTWQSMAPTILSVDGAGLVTGLRGGNGLIRASSGSAYAEIQIFVTTPRAASVALSRDTATITVPNGSVQLTATVADSGGHVITGPDIQWHSAAPLIAAVSAGGLVTAVAAGTAAISATVDGVSAQMTVTVTTVANANAPTVTAIAPTLMRPGGTYTLTGARFASTVAGNAVVVDGVSATVQSATSTQLVIALPTTGFTCEPTRQVFVQVTANGVIGGGAGTLQSANARTLAPGQSFVVTNPAEVRCNELSQTGGRYVVSVYNAYRTAVQQSANGATTVVVRGARGAATSAAAQVATALRRAPIAWASAPPLLTSEAFLTAERLRRARTQEQIHARMLDQSIAFLRAHPTLPHIPRSRAALSARSAFVAQLGTVGSITPIKVPNYDGSVCTSNFPIGVRTAFIGQHAIIVEDTASVSNGQPTLTGQMDAWFTQLGQEFDTVMWPILTANFGNPLALDAQLSGMGKVVMVFSPRVNGLQNGGIVGFVVSCDLSPVAEAPSSNVGEYFYAVVPTSTAAGYANSNTRDSWLRLIRGTVIHEVKHITAFAERKARALPFEDLSWEEGMARNVEELYARTFYGTQAKQDVTYAASVACDLRFTSPSAPCANRPALMIRHFDGLYQYLTAPDAFSPLGRLFPLDATFYASAWAIQRWASDHFAANDAQFLRAWTINPTTGILNLEAQTGGQGWETSLGEWSLAMYLDNAPGFTPANPRLQFPSWNLPDIWNGLCGDLGPCLNPQNVTQLYPRPTPFQPRAEPFGAFSVPLTLMGGAFTIFDITGTQAGTQLIEVRSSDGSGPAPTVRVAIVRVQ